MKKQIRCMIAVLLSLLLVISNSMSIDKVYGKEETYPDIEADIPYHMIKAGSYVNIKTKATLKGKKIGNIYYISENKKVAKVDQNGKISALKAGEDRIFVKTKGYPNYECVVYFSVVDRIIKISGSDKYRAGKTYQLKASEKNVRWEVYNNEEEDARASIDSDTGRLKIRNGGKAYAFCTSKDGKGKGAVYIYSKGVKIKNQIIQFNTIKINEDKHIVSMNELTEMEKFPEKVKLHYSNGKKNGVIESKVIWDTYQYFADDFKVIGKNTIKGTIEPPEGYTMSKKTYAKLIFDFQTEQTDNRKNIKSIEDLEPLTISKDNHICSYPDIVDYLKNVKLKCTLDDGSIISLPISGVGYSGWSANCDKVGTYQCTLGPVLKAGYKNEDELRAKLKFKIKTKQTSDYVSPKLTIKDIGGYSSIVDYESQAPFGK